MKKKIYNPGIIIQARMESKRLPGKMMLKLAGKPLIYHIIERLKKCKKVKLIVLAIPNNKKNRCLSIIAKKMKIKIYFGSSSNLVNRIFKAAKKFKIDPIIRIPGDNVIPEPREIDKIVLHHKKQIKPSFCSNLIPFLNSNYPDGIGAEVFDFESIKKLNYMKLNKKKKEHLHLNFINYKKGLAVNSSFSSISTIKCPKKFARPDLVFDINFEWQYLIFKKMYSQLYFKKKFFNINDSIKWVDQNVLKNNKILNR